MKTSDFDYELPEELIAQTPIEPRDHSRLLVYNRATREIEHKHFYDVIDYLNPGDALVINETRVIPARLYGVRAGGGACELLLLKQLGPKRWESLVRPGAKLKVGKTVSIGEGRMTATIVGESEGGGCDGGGHDEAYGQRTHARLEASVADCVHGRTPFLSEAGPPRLIVCFLPPKMSAA